MEPCEELGDKVLKICLSKKCCLVYFGSEPILRLTGKKMCLAKIVSLSLPLNGKGASSDTTGNLNFETSFFGVVLCSLLLFEHSLYPSCPNSCRLVRKKKKFTIFSLVKKFTAGDKSSYNNWISSSRSSQHYGNIFVDVCWQQGNAESGILGFIPSNRPGQAQRVFS